MGPHDGPTRRTNSQFHEPMRNGPLQAHPMLRLLFEPRSGNALVLLPRLPRECFWWMAREEGGDTHQGVR